MHHISILCLLNFTVNMFTTRYTARTHFNTILSVLSLSRWITCNTGIYRPVPNTSLSWAANLLSACWQISFCLSYHVIIVPSQGQISLSSVKVSSTNPPASKSNFNHGHNAVEMSVTPIGTPLNGSQTTYRALESDRMQSTNTGQDVNSK